MIGNQLYALVRKNLILKRRNYLSTLCELLFPMIIAAILVIPQQLVVTEAGTSATIHLDMNSYSLNTQIYGSCQMYTDGGSIPASFAFAPESAGRMFVAYYDRMNPDYTFPATPMYLESEEALNSMLKDESYPNGGIDGASNAVCGALVFNDDARSYKLRFNGTFEHDGWEFYRYTGFLEFMRLADGFLYEWQFGPVNTYPNYTQLVAASNQTYTIPDYETRQVQYGLFEAPAVSEGTQSEFLLIAANVICNPLFIVFSLSVARLVSLIVGERESKAREMMRIMGLKDFHFYTSWAITYAMIYAIIAIGISLILCYGGVFPKTAIGVLIMLFFLFGLGSGAFALLVSAPFDSQRSASIAAMAVYFFSGFVNIVIKDGQPLSLYIPISLLPQCALQVGINTIVKAELNGNGLQWDAMSTSLENYNMSWVFGMLAIDIFAYFFLYIYLDQVLPHRYGNKRPLLFFLTKSFWFGEGKVGNGTTDFVQDAAAVVEPFGAREQGLLDRKLCVETNNLRKTFYLDGAVVNAVDGVSVAMFDSEIFCLLGHNGAGKSTLINLLNGLERMSSGSASILGFDVETEMSKVRNSLGVCPQHDVLWDELTVAEHLKLFGSLRGVSSKAANSQITELISDVGLMKKRDTYAKNLSGGMKRRLSIALSFMGKSKFVILDEPTSGLDPYARRSVWDLLKRKKDGRIICLSTHFMDEAELLSDRIAILSMGKLKAYGSSMFLKSAFQCGYELTFVKQAKADERAIVERVKTCVRAVTTAPAMSSQVAALMGITEPISPRSGGGSSARLDSPRNGSSPRSSISPRASLTASPVPGTPRGVTRVLVRADSRVDGTSLARKSTIEELGGGRSVAVASNSGSELVVQVPFSAAPCFKILFSQIERDKDKLGVRTFGISSTKLEDVFMKIASAGHSGASRLPGAPLKGYSRALTAALGDRAGIAAIQPQNVETLAVKAGVYDGHKKTGLSLWQSHFKAETLKRLQQTKRDGRMFFCIFIMPLVLVIAGLGLGLVNNLVDIEAYRVGYLPENSTLAWSASWWAGLKQPNTWTEELLNVGLNRSDWSDTYMISPTNSTPLTGTELVDACKANGYLAPEPLVCNFWYNFAYDLYRDSGSGNYSQMGGIFVDNATSWQYTPQYNVPLAGFHSLDDSTPTSYQWQSNAMPRVSIFANLSHSADAPANLLGAVNEAAMQHVYYPDTNVTDFKTIAYNHPLPYTYQQIANNQFGPANNASVYVVIGLAFIAAAIAMGITKERQTGVKEQQLISGMHASAYWLARFSVDLTLYLITAGLIVILFVIFDIHKFLTNTGALSALTAVLFTFGPTFIAFTYFTTFFFRTVGIAQAATLAVNNIAGIVLSVVSNVMRLPALGETSNDVEKVLRYFFRIIPMFNMGDSIYNILVTRSYTPAPSVWSEDVTRQSLIALAIEFPIFVILTWFMEKSEDSPMVKNLMSKMKKFIVSHCFCVSRRKPEPVTGEDDMVLAEKNRVAEGVPDAMITLDNVKKSFGDLNAVKGVSIACQPGEVFGLLGLNGAGKTTAMKIAVGQIASDGGRVLIGGMDIRKALLRSRKTIGYCPQFDALIEELSVTEHLHLFGRLRGIPTWDLVTETNRLMDLLDLKRFAHTRAGTLSGGNKRKLSVAIALVGDPEIVCLDECSSGMDPLARRYMWSVIQAIAREKKRVIILTTHSMEEAEALSSRIAIMASGRFRCLGSLQELKNTYGKGFELSVKVKAPNANVVDAQKIAWGVMTETMTREECVTKCDEAGISKREIYDKEMGVGPLTETVSSAAFAEWWVQQTMVDKVKEFAYKKIPGDVSLIEGIGRVQKFLIRKCKSVLELFEILEAAKTSTDIEEYSVNQYSLEQIFNSFAKEDAVALAASQQS